jgi:hypothetical protein
MKKILSHDPLTGMTQIAHMPDADTFVVETQQDSTALIEQNKALYNQTDEKARWGDGWTRIASIPLAVFQELNKRGICRGFHIVDQKAMKAFLNDPENRHFRVRPGRV